MSRLSPPALLQAMATALPASQATSSLSSSYEVIALLVHAYLSSLAFRLTGFQEEKPSIPECETLAPQLPPQWNDGFGSLGFVYKHKQSAMTFVFRIDKMGAKVEVRGLAVGAENIYRFERSVRDVVDAKNLPVKITVDDAGNEDRSDLVEKLRKTFISEDVIAKLTDDLRVNIVQKLIPKLQSEDYEETADAEASATDDRRRQEAQNPNRPFASNDPIRPYPQPPHNPLPEMARPRPPPQGDFPPPGFDDEYDMNRPPGRMGGGLVMPGGRSPFNIGHDDLHPPGLGPHDPLRGTFGPGGLPRPAGGGGMHPTFDDPLFTGQGGVGGGPGAGGGYDPQAPPGARWDPLGPGGRGPRFPPGSGGGGNFFGGDII